MLFSSARRSRSARNLGSIFTIVGTNFSDLGLACGPVRRGVMAVRSLWADLEGMKPPNCVNPGLPNLRVFKQNLLLANIGIVQTGRQGADSPCRFTLSGFFLNGFMIL